MKNEFNSLFKLFVPPLYIETNDGGKIYTREYFQFVGIGFATTTIFATRN